MTDTGQPLDHIQRPQPPWRRSQHITECGKPLGGALVITRDELRARLRDLGKTRTSMITCMTCWQTAARNPAWEENPVLSLLREVRRFESAASPYTAEGDPGSSATFRDELLAMAELVERHRSEFDALLAGLRDAVSLGDARRKRRRA